MGLSTINLRFQYLSIGDSPYISPYWLWITHFWCKNFLHVFTIPEGHYPSDITCLHRNLVVKALRMSPQFDSVANSRLSSYTNAPELTRHIFRAPSTNLHTQKYVTLPDYIVILAIGL